MIIWVASGEVDLEEVYDIFDKHNNSMYVKCVFHLKMADIYSSIKSSSSEKLIEMFKK